MSSDDFQSAASSLCAVSDKNKRRRNNKRTRRETTIHYENKEPNTLVLQNSKQSFNKRAPLQTKDSRARETSKRVPKRAATAAVMQEEQAPSPRTKGRHVCEDYYEIDSILDKRINAKGEEEFLVRWKDCSSSDDTWEHSENLCDSALDYATRMTKQEEAITESKSQETRGISRFKRRDAQQCPGRGTKRTRTPTTNEEMQASLEPTHSHDEELPLKWNDEEQVIFRDVVRINVNDSNASRLVAQARESGVPVVLVGHEGCANFAIRWLVVNEEAGDKEGSLVDTTVKEDVSNEEVSSPLLDLSRPHALDISRMIDDIGEELVPVVTHDYDEEKPISRTVPAKSFLEQYRKDFSSSGNSTSEGSGKAIEPYLHQWQFPLSETGGRNLCHQNTPLPNGILREDLLKHWLGYGDSPLQYIFMGVQGTMSKLHKDCGGLAILIAPIVGEKECVLVHRDDGERNLYSLDANLNAIDLESFPLMSLARVWKTVVRPGEILLMPSNTYHQCRNLTPCLSYSRFHLDTVNIQFFLASMYEGDANELQHEEVIWNAVHGLVDEVDNYVDNVQNHVMHPNQHEDCPLTVEMGDIVKDVRCLRNVCRAICLRKAQQADVTGQADAEADVPVYSANEWGELIEEIDSCLNHFRCRRTTRETV